VALGLALFWSHHISGPGLVFAGRTADPEIFIWFINWWLYASQHHLPWFTTNFVAYPTGVELGWRTSVPSLALLTLPVTLKYGALTSYNLVMTLSPGLAGAGAYLAARELTGKTVPAIAGGLVFGFSSYEMAQSLNHLHLCFTAAIPLCVWVVLRAEHKAWSTPRLGLALGLLLAFEFGVSQEVCASFILFTLAGLAAAYAARPSLRPVLTRLAPGLALSLGVAFLLILPLLWPMLTGLHVQDRSIASPLVSSGDLLTFFIPTPITYLGGTLLRPWAWHFSANIAEADGYLGLPLILLLAHIARTASALRPLLAFAAVIAVLSLGPYIHLGGILVSTGPWLPFSLLPFFSAMLPSRFMLFAWLAIALALAQWLALAPSRQRYAAVLLAAVFCAPNLNAVAPWSDVTLPTIFTTDPAHLLQRNLLILPYKGNEMGDQYASGMKFHLIAQGYLVPGIPQPFFGWPLITPLYKGNFPQIDPAEFATFLAFYGAQQVLVIENELPNAAAAQTLLQKAGWTETGREDGVDVYQPPATPPANLAAQAQAYQQSAQLARAERRERINICALRHLAAATGLNLAPLYARFEPLPQPIASIQCTGAVIAEPTN